jgi:hypothetical protein
MKKTAIIPSRREFAKALAVLAAAATPAAAQEAKQPDAKSYAEAVETVIRFRFGKRLTGEQIKKVRSSYMNRRSSAESLKRVEIANGDDPITAFRADLP